MHRDTTSFPLTFPLSTSSRDRLLVSSRWSVRIIFEGMETKKQKITECSKCSILSLKEHILLLTDFQWMHLFAKNPWEEGEANGIGIARAGHMAMGNL